jgi:primosomal protein N' (replication factor Y)
MAERHCDILIGTQMIAKGHDLPGITLVGIVLADVGLSLPDFRAGERLFHVVTQVAGRCGRGSQPGEVIVQTFNPEEATLLLAARYDWAGFYQQELLQRKGVVYPPFCRLILLVLQGNRERGVKEAAQRLGGLARELQTRGKKGRQDVLEILGPAPAPIGRLRGKHRYQLLIKGRDVAGLHTFLKRLLNEREGMKTHRGVELTVDVDPQAFL